MPRHRTATLRVANTARQSLAVRFMARICAWWFRRNQHGVETPDFGGQGRDPTAIVPAGRNGGFGHEGRSNAGPQVQLQRAVVLPGVRCGCSHTHRGRPAGGPGRFQRAADLAGDCIGRRHGRAACRRRAGWPGATPGFQLRARLGILRYTPRRRSAAAEELSLCTAPARRSSAEQPRIQARRSEWPERLVGESPRLRIPGGLADAGAQVPAIQFRLGSLRRKAARPCERDRDRGERRKRRNGPALDRSPDIRGPARQPARTTADPRAEFLHAPASRDAAVCAARLRPIRLAERAGRRSALDQRRFPANARIRRTRARLGPRRVRREVRRPAVSRRRALGDGCDAPRPRRTGVRAVAGRGGAAGAHHRAREHPTVWRAYPRPARHGPGIRRDAERGADDRRARGAARLLSAVLPRRTAVLDRGRQRERRAHRAAGCGRRAGSAVAHLSPRAVSLPGRV